MIKVDLQVATDSRIPSKYQLSRWVKTVLEDRGKHKVELTIRMVSEKEGVELNHLWRSKNYATNVLSFPAELPDKLLKFTFLGDIIICPVIVEREASLYGIQINHHWAHLVIHGCLHLLGYNHEESREAEEMEGIEGGLLKRLGYT